MDPHDPDATLRLSAPDPMAKLPKQVGRYQVVSKIGAGGMGEVFRAYDPVLGRLVALKRLFSHGARALGGADAAHDDDALRLQREAQAIAQLSHPNVIAVFDVGTDSEGLYIAMEYVEGLSLGKWQQEAPRSRESILEVFRQAAQGLAALHAAGLVHRDFKPSNVLVGRDGRVRVLDFGLARRGNGEPSTQSSSTDPKDAPLLRLNLTQSGVLAGTPRYMAPEQFKEQPVDGRADQFAFAAALYEALTGRRPFAGEDILDLARNVVAGRVLPLRPEDALPGWLERLVMRGLSRNVEERLANMQQVVSELSRDRRTLRHQTLDGSQTSDLVSAFPPPEDAGTRERVQWLRSRLDYAGELKKKGDYRGALALLSVVVEKAEGLDYPPLRAASLYALGNLEHRLGDSASSRATLYRAAEEAAIAGDDWQLANIWVCLVSVLGQGLSRHEEADGLLRVARASVLRLGNNPSLLSRLLLAEGQNLRDRGRAQEALRVYEIALQTDGETHGEEHPLLAVTLSELAACELELLSVERAGAHLERATTICEAHGRRGPTYATCLLLRGRVLALRGELQSANKTLHDAEALFRRYPDRRADLGATLAERAAVQLALDDPSEGLALAEQALLEHEQGVADRLGFVRCQLVLARALRGAPLQDLARIEQLRRAAREACDALGALAESTFARLDA